MFSLPISENQAVGRRRPPLRWLAFSLGWAAVLCLGGCSGRSIFGWQYDIFGNPHIAGQEETADAEIRLVAQQADSLRAHWSQPEDLRVLADLYQKLVDHYQWRARSRLEKHYESLPEAEQQRFGPAEKQASETTEDYQTRAQARYARLRESALEAVDPQLYEAYWRLANTQYFIAEGIDPEEDLDEKLAMHEAGLHSGERALDLFPEFRKAIAAGLPEEEAVQRLDKDAIPAIYWTTTNLSRWARLKGFSYILFHRNRAKAMIEHVRALDASWYYGAADRYLGTFYAVAPSMAGGDMELSRQHFDQSLAVAPHYLGTHNLVAEFWATKMQDRDLFEKELRFVLEAPVDTYPDIIPLQKIEKEKAKKLLAKIDEYF